MTLPSKSYTIREKAAPAHTCAGNHQDHPRNAKRQSADEAVAGGSATLVDVTGLVIYFTVAYAVLRGTLL